MDELLTAAAEMALAYVAGVDERRVSPSAEAVAALTAFDEPLPERGADPLDTLRLLDRVGAPATMASTGARYFGFVNGATLPVALGAAWLADAWDQNAALPVMSPVAATLHDVAARWLVDVLGLPSGAAVAFVSGATVANAACLAAARDELLMRAGWDVQADGLFGAPPINVVVGARAHSTLSKSLGLVGLGRQRVTVVPADDQGRLRAELLPDLDSPVLVCTQAGEVNTGAFDPFDAIADWLAARTGWLHVDGAFGLWARADPGRAGLVARARPRRLLGDRRTQVAQRHLRLRHRLRPRPRPPASHVRGCGRLPPTGGRLRGDAPHAAVVAAGAPGRGVGCVAEPRPRRRRPARAPGVRRRRHHRRAPARRRRDDPQRRRAQPGTRARGDGARTAALIAAMQADGRVWCGPTQWDGDTAMRISVSSWKTGPDDAAFAADVILELAAAL